MKRIKYILLALFAAIAALFYFFRAQDSDLVVRNRTKDKIEMVQISLNRGVNISGESLGALLPGKYVRKKFPGEDADLSVTIFQGGKKAHAECGRVNALEAHFLVEVEDGRAVECERFSPGKGE